MKLDQNANETRNLPNSDEHSECERPHLGFESMLRGLIAHPKELEAIADKKHPQSPHQFPAEIHLWKELGKLNQEVWRKAFFSDDFQRRLESLEAGNHSWLYDAFGFEFSDGRVTFFPS
jgi:hypothetical protein